MHGDGRLWHSRDPGFIDELARDVRSGNYFAMGEFEARHYPSNTNNRDVHLPVDSPYFEALFILSAETGMPFLIHHEAEDKLLAEMEHMLAKYPKAKVVWCHVGRNRNPETWRTVSRPEGVRALLNKYPNLYFDIVQSKPGSKYPWTGHVDAVIYASGRGGTGLDPAWKALFEEFPDRFMIGSDANTQRFHNYDQVMATFRDVVLTSLRRDVAERIAYKNAWKLITGQDWVK
jgi:predicted TIM-barrel fold metal-dependent hydrolase